MHRFLNSSQRRSHLLISLILIVASVFLFLGGPEYSARRSYKELWNLGHIAYFALLTAQLIRWKLLHRYRLRTQWVLYLVLTLILGTLIELLQYGTARSPDIEDILRDLVGTLLVLSFAPGFLQLPNRKWQNSMRVGAVLLFCIHLIPLTQSTIDEFNAHLSFPAIADFETPFEAARWKGSATREVVRLDPEIPRYQLKIGFNTDKYSSASMQYLTQDWSQYGYLYFSIFQPSGEPLKITIRIHDEAHEVGLLAYEYDDRFNRRFELPQGWNTIKIPLSDIRLAARDRHIDLSRISNLNLFTSALLEPREIFLEEVYLSNQ